MRCQTITSIFEDVKLFLIGVLCVEHFLISKSIHPGCQAHFYMRGIYLIAPFYFHPSLAIQHLVVEQASTLLDEGDTKLLGGFKHSRIILATSWRSNVLGSRSGSTVNIINERELFLLEDLRFWVVYLRKRH
jgi:hypothetical protein